MTRLLERLTRMAERARNASRVLSELSSAQKSEILNEVATAMELAEKKILLANAKDLKTARQMKLSEAAIDRLTLNSSRVQAMAKSVRDVARLQDPVGRVTSEWKRPNGLQISKVTVPLGLILIIYESRPNVTSECASLCFKSGNSVLLRGGREALHSNQAISDVYTSVLKKKGLPVEAVTFVSILDRHAIDLFLKMDKLINLAIPRGGEALIRRVVKNARIPVVKHDKGICHVYVDQKADIGKAIRISVNAKCQRTGVCNAMETLLVHQKIASQFLIPLGRALSEKGCEVRGDQTVRKFISGAKKATEEDWKTEYLDNILSIKVVENLEEAVKHIQTYGSSHTDAIVTEDGKAANQFVAQVDSSSVMVNASTRFSDGNEYGFGAEIGISTDKIHARGPMGLDGLVSYKYVVRGDGQIRA